MTDDWQYCMDIITIGLDMELCNIFPLSTVIVHNKFTKLDIKSIQQSRNCSSTNANLNYLEEQQQCIDTIVNHLIFSKYNVLSNIFMQKFLNI